MDKVETKADKRADEQLAKRIKKKVKTGKMVRQRGQQAFRPRPEGPDRITCVVIEEVTGRTVTQAAGHVTRKYAASSAARVNALRALKRKLGQRYVMVNKDGSMRYELAYRYN